MRQDGYLSENEIRKAIAVLKPNGELFEIRALADGKATLSGYFKDADTLISAFDSVDVRNRNIYITLNPVNDALYSRIQHDKFVQVKKDTTSDGDIIGYDWFFIDLDPIRPTGISSSNSELQESIRLARKVYLYLKNLGFNEPVKALSGNGCHLLYRVNLANSDENKELLSRCLKALDEMFGNAAVKIDTVNCNQSRICKLYGTLAQKGANTKERPHRLSRIFSYPQIIEPTDKVFLQKLADELPEELAAPAPSTYKGEQFDLERFMDDNGLTYNRTQNARDSIVYMLDECPFNPDHKDGDAKIFHYSNGAIAFKCHHNSCHSYKWQDVRRKYDPGCYDQPVFTDFDKRIDEGWKQHNRNKTAEELPYINPEPQEEKQMFRTARQIYEDVEPDLEYIPTGITGIDNLMFGLAKTEITVVSGVRGSGKSTWLGQIILNCVENKHTVVCYSGELKDKKYLNWLFRQAAGHNNVDASSQFKNGYGVTAEKKEKIIDWFGEYYWHYNNDCGNKFKEIAKVLRNTIITHRADLCIIDNLMILDLQGIPGSNKYEQQSEFVKELAQLAKDTNCHIIFVAHPRKATGFMRLDDISGTGDIGNIVDNAFIIHRVNHDFRKKTKEEYGWKDDCEHYFASNVIEIAKERENGNQDVFIDLFFDEASKRLMNTADENIVYSWDTSQANWVATQDSDVPF